MQLRWFFLVLTSVNWMAPVFAYGAIYYVAKTGSDNHSCSQAQSPSTAKVTINAGIHCLSGGDTLIIKSGTYTETILAPDTNIPSGTQATPTTIRVVTGDTVTLNGSGQYVLSIWNRTDIVIDGLDRNLIFSGSATTHGLVFIQDSHRITIQNTQLRDTTNPSAQLGGCFTMQSQLKAASVGVKLINNEVANCGLVISSGHGIYLSYCEGCIIEGNNIHGTADMGIHNYNSAGLTINNNNIIRFNHIYNTGSAGILVGAGDGTIVHHNIVRNNGRSNNAGGIRIGYNSPNNFQLYNNTIYANTGPCIYVKADSSSSKIKNNLSLSNTTNVIDNNGTGTVMANNRLSTDATLVVDVTNAQFSPRAQSGLIDAGENISGFSAGKFVGAAPDQGALEFVPPAPPSMLTAPANLQVGH